MIKKIKTLKIDRSKWRTGSDHKVSSGRGDTMLLNDKGFMCCLGFFCHQSGVPKTKLKDESNPGHVISDKIFDIPLLTCRHGVETNLTDNAMNVNDSDSKRKEKEIQLKKLFAKKGVRVVFIGKYKNNPLSYLNR